MPFGFRFPFFELLLVGSLLFAFLRGGAPERIVSLLLLIAFILSFALSSRSHYVHFETGVFLVDFTLFPCLYALSICSTRFWPIWMCAMQGLAVMAHLLILVSPKEAAGYQIMVQFWCYPIQSLLIVASWRHHRRVRLYGADPAWVFSHR